MQTSLIPPHIAGKQNDLQYSSTFADSAAAILCFERAVRLLLSPNNWQKLAGAGSALFELVNASGTSLPAPAKKGDYFKIDLPGPGSVSGDGFDWVRVEAIEQQRDALTGDALLALKVVACANPTSGNDETAAHFFSEGASSTFVLTRHNNKVTASYHGRNEVPNTDTDHIADNLRNAIAGSLALLGISELQWSALLKGILEAAE